MFSAALRQRREFRFEAGDDVRVLGRRLVRGEGRRRAGVVPFSARTGDDRAEGGTSGDFFVRVWIASRDAGDARTFHVYGVVFREGNACADEGETAGGHRGGTDDGVARSRVAQTPRKNRARRRVGEEHSRGAR